jgi:hypothetical protein
MYRYIIFNFSIIAIFAGCSQNLFYKTKELPLYTTKEYTNINKDNILNAAKKVILLSDKQYVINSYVNDIEATRMIARYKGYDVDLEINKINIEITKEKNIVTAKLTILQKKDYFDKDFKIIKNSTHKLIWDRIDYILGLNNKWASCFSHNLSMNYDGVLCDFVYNKNTTATKQDIMQDIYMKSIDKQMVDNNESLLQKIDLPKLENIQLPNQIKSEQTKE